MMKKLKNIIITAIILLLATVAYVYIIDNISIATSSGGVGLAATEDSKQNPVEAKDWSEKVDEEGRNIVKSVWADTLENILRSQGKDEQIMDDGTIYITLEDYRTIPSLFCSAHGTAMPGWNSTIVRSGGLETSVTDQDKKTAFLTVEDIDSATVFRNQTEWTEYTTDEPDNPFETTTSKTIGRFTNKGIKKATPAEAWVLAELDKNVPGGSGEQTVEVTNEEFTGEESEITGTEEIDGEEYYVYGNPGEEKYLKKDGDKYYIVNVGYSSGGSGTTSYVQYAWWKVKTCGLPSTTTVEDLDGGLAAEAEAFEQYIIKATGNSDVHNLERNADDTFKIDYKVSMTPDNAEDVVVRFNSETNKYIVGPYTVSYLRACTQQEERAKVSFAGIDSVTLVGTSIDGEEVLDEDGNSVLQLGENYRFVYQDEEAHKQRRNEEELKADTDEDYPYPYPDEEFYIEMDYLEDMAYLKSLKFDFQYMTANGSYELFEGDYLLITWEPMTDVRSQLVSGSGGSAYVTNNTTSVALQTDVSDRASKLRRPTTPTTPGKLQNKNKQNSTSTNLGEMQGTYKANVDFNEVKSYAYDQSGTTSWLAGGVNVLKVTDTAATKSNDEITVTAKVENQAWDWVFFNWMSKRALSGTTGGIVSGSTSFTGDEFSFKIDASDMKDPYVEKDYHFTIYWGNAELSFSIHVYWYNSILNNDGKISISSADADKLELDSNTIYYEGILNKDSNQVELSLDPYKASCSQYNGSLYLTTRYDDSMAISKNGDKITAKIRSNGNGTLLMYVSADHAVTEQIELGYTVPDMAITSRGNTSESCEATAEEQEFQLYNAFTDELKDSWNGGELPDAVQGRFEDGKYYISRSGVKVAEDGNETITLTDGCGSNVSIDVSWKGDTIGSRNPMQVIGAGYEYSYRYYMVASEASSATAQTQINACGDHERIDVTAENGLGSTVSGVPVELEFIHELIPLYTSMSGMVWIDHDEQKDVSNSGTLGIYDEGTEDEPAKENSVEIVVWKVKYEVATGTEVEREKALGWKVDENGKETEIDFENTRLYVDDQGRYEIPKIRVPAEEGLDGSKYVMSYDVEFIYDGQTYEATEYLVPEGKADTTTVDEKLKAFKKEADETAGPDKDYTEYAKSSYIVENANDRYDFDKYFTEIYGDKSITDEGKTEGKATGGKGGSQYTNVVNGDTQEKEAKLNYDSVVVGEEGAQKTKSNLVTYDENNFVYDQYKFAARTSEAGLLLPYERKYHTKAGDYDNYVFQEDQYKPIDEYFHQINLGLLERYHSDLGVKKDLYSAKVVVNSHENLTTYNSLMPLTEEALNLQVKPEYRQRTYKIDLYNSDYMYRSSAYSSITDELTKTVIEAVKEGTELRLFVTYKLEFINESVFTDVSVNEFVDYYDKTFTRVDNDIVMPIEDQRADDEDPTRIDKTVAYAPYYRKLTTVAGASAYNYNKAEDLNESLDESGNVRNTVVNSTGELILDKAGDKFATGKVEFEDIEETDEERKNSNYKKSVSKSLNGLNGNSPNEDLTLEPGEVLEVFVTYEIDEDGYKKVQDETVANAETRKDTLLGKKNNIVEISRYSTFYTEESCQRHTTLSYLPKQVSGRVDQDSAPNNIKMKDRGDSIDTKMLEDDTEYAPCVEVRVRDAEPRTLDGVVWEDKRNDNDIGDGLYKTDSGDKPIEGIDVTMVEKIRVTTEDLEKIKKYAQEKYPNAYNDLKDLDVLSHEFEYIWKKDQIPGFTAEVKSGTDGTYKFENFVTGTYVVRFEYGNDVNETDLKYNGQDYKNTTYQVAADGSIRKNPTKVAIAGEEQDVPIDTTDILHLPGKATLNNEWHDLSANSNAKSLEEDRVSDARDYEPQRIRTIAYSRTIANENAENLAAAIDKTVDVTGEEAIKHANDDYKNILTDNDNKEELIENTRMVANTAKLFVDIEKQDTIAYKKVITPEGEDIVKTTEAKDNPEEKYEYYIKNIDFGLVERPETRMNIRKEISKIELYKEDGGEIILSVSCDENGDIVKAASGNVRVDKITEIRKENLAEGQGFKYIAMESSLLNGLQIKITYNISIINNSEKDYVSGTLANYKGMNEIYELANHFENISEERLYAEEGLQGTVPFNSGKAIIYGRYLGTYYYTNKYIDNVAEINATYAAVNENGNTINKYDDEVIVRTTIDQVVDYIDNDLSISLDEINGYENKSWVASSDDDVQHKLSEISFEKDENDEYVKDITKLQDDKERTYISKNTENSKVKNNIYLSRNNTMVEKPTEIKCTSTKIKAEDKAPEMTVVNGKLQPVTEDKTHQAYTSKENTNSGDNANSSLTTELVPDVYKKEVNDDSVTSTANISIITSAQANEESVNNMNYDNLIEVAMYSNSVGRRDMQTIPGNANMIAKDNKAYLAGYIKVYDSSSNSYVFKTQTVNGVNTERDAYAARDTVTFSEPTGLSLARQQANKTIRILLASLIIAAIAVVAAIIVTAIRRNKYDDGDILKTKN